MSERNLDAICVVALLVSLALSSNIAFVPKVSAVNGIKADAWTDKGNNDQLHLPWGCVGCYRIGEQVTIYYSVDVDCQAKLTLRKPDGSDTVLFEGSLKAGMYRNAVSAALPTGYRNINFEAWVGDKKASDTFSFCIVHDYVRFKGKVLAHLPTYGGGDFWKIEVSEVLLDPTGRIQGIIWVHWHYSLAQVSPEGKQDDYAIIFGGYIGKYQMGASEGEFVCLGNREHFIKNASAKLLVVDVWTDRGGQGRDVPDGTYQEGDQLTIYYSVSGPVAGSSLCFEGPYKHDVVTGRLAEGTHSGTLILQSRDIGKWKLTFTAQMESMVPPLPEDSDTTWFTVTEKARPQEPALVWPAIGIGASLIVLITFVITFRRRGRARTNACQPSA